MRLLQSDDNGNLSLTEFFESAIPNYAILSHRWGTDEVTFKDLTDGTSKSKAGGYSKIQFCGEQARRDGLKYFWVDTCCIDKSSSAELSEAINSMFRWYQKAARCYVYLSDVSIRKRKASDTSAVCTWESAFRASKWFTRGWTLQELLAPRLVEFYSREGKILGNKRTLEQQIYEITGVPATALRENSLSQFNVDERFSWAKSRQTTRGEDKAYSLFGIFDVQMPLLYGEGEVKALNRLRDSIGDAWRGNFARSLDVLTYFPLEDSEVRILILAPGDEETSVTANSTVLNLQDLQILDYDALSYAWGHEPAIHPIFVNDRRLLIRPNLFQALRRIRNPDKHMYLWVDSVCIDQSNDVEKTTQVKQMADIYRKAQNVWIWLGEEDSTSQIAIDLIFQILRPEFQWNDVWWEQSEFVALDRILERSWFRRGWVIQEAAFSTSSIIFCGNRQVRMDDFANAINMVRSRISKTSNFPSARKNVQFHGVLPNLRDSSATRLLEIIQDCFSRSEDGAILNRRLTLETLVGLGTFYETTDQRDAIYALLSLANDVDSPSNPNSPDTILPDYSKTPLDVFASFISYCCRESDSLDIICRPWAPVSSSTVYATCRRGQVDETLRVGAPSWILSRDGLPLGNPSWRMTRRLHGNPLVGSSQKRIYNAHYNTKPQVHIGRISGSNTCDGSLYANGIIIGEVTLKSTRMAEAIITQDCLRVLGGISYDQLSNLVSLPDMIWQVLCADCNGKGDRAPLYFRSAMLHMLKLNSVYPTTAITADWIWSRSSIDVGEVLSTDLPGSVKEFLDVVQDVVWNRRTFQGTGTDHYECPIAGLIPQSATESDKICILFGCSVPVVLRKRPWECTKHYWELIGEAYVHGFMDGKGISSLSPAALDSVEVEFEIR